MAGKPNRAQRRVHGEDEPIFFRYYDHVSLSPPNFGLPKGLILLLFDSNREALCDPNAEPIAAYYVAGVRHYLWRDTVWAETDFDRRGVERRIHHKLNQGCDEAQRYRLLYILKLIGTKLHRGAPNLRSINEPTLSSIRDRLCRDNDRITLDKFTHNWRSDSVYCRSVYRIN